MGHAGSLTPVVRSRIAEDSPQSQIGAAARGFVSDTLVGQEEEVHRCQIQWSRSRAVRSPRNSGWSTPR
ncbi:hypothetical protein CURTO8I2_120076 [Curtobacterium sp. 8I-2]|nr:hypothetical protein CURTO8I2_120076 [Curtobacterium sp. 8I-2]